MDTDTPFETDEPGTSEHLWLESLARVPAWLPRSTALTVVSPHPDDETFGAGGLIYTCAQLGYGITVVLVTDGENARPEMSNLAARRHDELRTAMTCLAPDGARVVRLMLPDGGVTASEQYLTRRLLLTVPPHSTLVAPYEHDGHADHNATSRACQAAARKLGVPCVRYPIWAWHRLRPDELGSPPMGRLPLSPRAQAAKQQAIECYRSQTEPRPGGAIVPPHVLTYFRRPYEVFLL
ncbi:MAG: PIG-L deacetylase family protein [Gammaproteobacteria bacterium]